MKEILYLVVSCYNEEEVLPETSRRLKEKLSGMIENELIYERNERFAGESKYPLKKMLAFALDGVTSFSIKPISIITGLGFSIFIISMLALVYTLIVKIFGKTVTGWTSLTLSIWMIGGIQLLSLGVIGEYVGKIYNETKHRPRFIISEKANLGCRSNDMENVS